jgi:hypothetical protein
VSVKDFAAMIGVSPTQIYQMMWRREIPFVKLNVNSAAKRARVLINPDVALEYIERRYGRPVRTKY